MDLRRNVGEAALNATRLVKLVNSHMMDCNVLQNQM
jgi:hypothetical protein